MPRTGRPRKHAGKPQAVYLYDRELFDWLKVRSAQTKQPISEIVELSVGLFRATVVSLQEKR
jgi:hypothetical protein